MRRSRRVADMRKATEPERCGATVTAKTDYIIARRLEDTLAVKINTVTAMAAAVKSIDIAVEKGEVVCRGMTIVAPSWSGTVDTLHKKGFDRQFSRAARKESLD
jgi:hypothetical protein